MRLVASVLLACAACGTQGPLPTARIDLSPATLCEGDSLQPVAISGSRSQSADGTPDQLAYSWSFSTQPLEIMRGGLHQEDLVVRFAARHPVRVSLKVEQEDGSFASREALLSLTRMELVACDRGCAAHETCVVLDGASLCVDDLICNGDDECGCLRCAADDSGVRRCVP